MDPGLGDGQRIELDMGNAIGLKVFQVYRPLAEDLEREFTDVHIDVVTAEIARWYEMTPDHDLLQGDRIVNGTLASSSAQPYNTMDLPSS